MRWMPQFTSFRTFPPEKGDGVMPYERGHKVLPGEEREREREKALFRGNTNLDRGFINGRNSGVFSPPPAYLSRKKGRSLFFGWGPLSRGSFLFIWEELRRGSRGKGRRRGEEEEKISFASPSPSSTFSSFLNP